MSSAEVVYCKWLPNITDELSIVANSVDQDQTAPIGAVWSGSTLFTQVNRMSKSRRVLAIGGKQRSFGLHMVCFEMVLYHNEPH